ncbi:MAG: hypothetical protein ABIH46_03260 [Chloroflexota bacterium]
MSRRKDRERYELRKRLDPNYKGFRAPEVKPEPKPELKPLTCPACGRVRNVAVDTPEEGFICSSCQKEEA